jgi:acyl transferase domain-containing protein
MAATEPVAIIGMSCRVPGANDLAAFWDLLVSGRSGIGPVPETRAGHSGAGRASAGYLEQIDQFDAAFFGLSPREAVATDPRQRLALELSWEALEHAGVVPGSVAGTGTGVFVGVSGDDYAAVVDDDGVNAYLAAGTNRAVIANRVSHLLDARGPSLVVDTAQSSSLVAVHLACESIARGESVAALAGGVNLNLSERRIRMMAELGVVSPDGECFAFDVRANGFVPGEGGGFVVLKPLSTAEADGDTVHAVICGTAINQDGATFGLSSPNPAAQADVIRAAQARARVEAGAITFVELHGTGTKVGDATEARALSAVFAADPARTSPLLLGSVKTNIGHLDAAAGVAGLIKTVLSLAHGTVAPTLNYVEPNPDVDLSCLRVADEVVRLPTEGSPPIAGVSSFGMGGTNCHIVVSGPVHRIPLRKDTSDHGIVPWVLSGRAATAACAQAARLRDWVRDRPEIDVRDVAWSLASTRSAFEERLVLLGADRNALLSALDAAAAGISWAGVISGPAVATDGAVWVFPGQGSQWAGMGRVLLRESEVFRARLAECDAALAPWVPWSVRDVLLGTGNVPDLHDDDVIQPTLFAVMVSLAAIWQSWGAVPSAVLGHSQGELTAACVAGALTLEDAARAVALRSQALRQLNGNGGMLAVALAEVAVRHRLAGLLADGHVSIAAVNGPRAVVLAGSVDALQASTAALDGVRCRTVPVDYASHTAQVDEIKETLLDRLGALRPRQGSVPFYSTVTAAPVDTATLNADYWFANIRQTVRFRDTVDALIRDGRRTFLEVSPHPLLTVDIRDTLEGAGVAGAVIGSLRRGADDTERLLAAAGELFVSGAEIDWTAVLAGLNRTGRRVSLPTYAFQRKRHWLDAAASSATHAVSMPVIEDPGVAMSTAGPTTEFVAMADRVSGLGEPEQRQFVLDTVAREMAIVLGHSSPTALDRGRVFRELGFDSLMSADLCTRLSAVTGLRLSTALTFDHPTPTAVADFVLRQLLGHQDANGRATARSLATNEPLAIVGMACRLPGGITSPENLWRFVTDGGHSASGFPADRGWDPAALNTIGADPRGTSYTDQGGFLPDAAGFDAAFFGISPREALAMDPQQRLLLEVTWEALENAGIPPTSLRGSDTGVFAGVMPPDYGPRLHEGAEDSNVGGYLLTGSAPSVVSGRVAYVLGLQGPAISVDTACSSSLVALHLAGQSLGQGDCSLALVGGATVMATPGMFVEFSRQGGLAPDGRCKSFAAAADGTAWSEGVGVLVVERLSDARRQGHPVLALVRSSAVNQDGASNGLTAPNGPSQRRVIQQALATAGLVSADVDVVEAHGTGTTLGDPIEAQALLATYGQDRPADRPLWIGTVKSNIGHTQAAAGVAGVIKMVMAMRHGVLPATLHVDEPSPHVDWSAGAVSLLTENTPWPDVDRPRRAAVSSFGISGTNAHVILEQVPPDEVAAAQTAAPTRTVPWVLSGRGTEAVRAQARNLHTWLTEHPDAQPADVSSSLVRTRSVFEDRVVVLGNDRATLLAGLAAAGSGELSSGVITGSELGATSGTVFVFPGQGSQWIGMGRALWSASAAFRQRLADCDAALSEWLPWSVQDAILRDDARERDRADIVQPMLFAVMVSLAAVWESWGVKPSAVVGHSQGEIAAACVAGALTLRDAAKVVALRGLALCELAGGGMWSVALSEEDVAARLEPWLADERVSIAAVNGPGSVVLAGRVEALREVIAALDGVNCREIPVDYASHSAQVERIRPALMESISGIEPQPARVPFYSTVTAGRYDTTGLDAGYWFTNLRQTVRLRDTVDILIRDGYRVFVEVSPHPVLTTGIIDTLDVAAERGVVVGSLRRDADDVERMLTAGAELFVAGTGLDWTAVLTGLGSAGRQVPLPTYAFQHQKFWLPAGNGRQAPPDADEQFWEVVERGDAEELTQALALPPDRAISTRDWAKVLPALSSWRRTHRVRSLVDRWRYRVRWKPHEQLAATTLNGVWLIIVPDSDHDVADACAAALTGHGAQGVVVRADDAAMAGDLGAWRYLLTDAVAGAGTPAGIVSLLGLAQEPHPEHPVVPRGVSALLGLVRVLDDNGVTAPLWCATQGAVSTGETDPLTRPAQALTWGLGRAVALERPQSWGGLVDLPDALDTPAWDRLGRVLAAGDAEDQFAVRASGVFIRRLVPAPGHAHRPSGWTPQGTVLVTGGTGAVAAHLARWLARQGAPRLILMSRSGPGAPGADTLADELERIGAAVDIIAGDITDRAALTAALDRIPAEHPLTAVFHAAGVNEETAVRDLDVETFARVIEAKVAGADALREVLTERRESASLVFFSSGAGTWGAGAQGAYAAGNAYLDALVEHSRGEDVPVTAIAWGAWAESGMASGEAGRRFDRLGVASMAPDLATEALGQALAAGETGLVVADVDWARFYPNFAVARPRPLLHDIPAVASLLSAEEAFSSPAPEGELAAKLAAMSSRDQHEALLDLVRLQAAAVLGHLDTDRIRPDRAFRDAGFDSLTAVDLRSRLNQVTGSRLSATAVFNHPTPSLLAGHMRELLLGTENRVLDTIAALESELTAISDDQGLMSEVCTRLEKLVSATRSGQMITVDPTDASDLMDATDDEVFGILRDEFGIS